jgi:hypothetical protein
MTDRKKPGVVFWAAVVVVCLPALYVASFGPVARPVPRRPQGPARQSPDRSTTALKVHDFGVVEDLDSVISDPAP